MRDLNLKQGQSQRCWTMPPKKKLKIELDPKQPQLSFYACHREDEAEQTQHETESSKEKKDTKEERNFQERWLRIWSWLEFRDNKMFCSMCIKYKKANAFTSGCQTLKTSSMYRHEASDDHKNCSQEQSLKQNMAHAIKKSYEAQDNAIIKALKVVYWLASENIPLSKYESFLTICKQLDIPGMEPLSIGGSNRVNYCSYYAANELLNALCTTIDEDINSLIAKSPYISVLCDESTDISNTARMTINFRLINPETGAVKSVFINDIEYEDGTGEGLCGEIIKVLESRNINTGKVVGLGTDGASVMTGKDKGVYGRLKALNPHLINIHCLAHRLALCTSQAATGLKPLKNYQEWMCSLFYYFKRSAQREKQLHKVQSLLDHPTLKYREVHSVRWMSFYEALEAVFRTLDPLLTYLHSRGLKDPTAKGLLKSLATTQFLYITHMMMDVIPIVSKLCLTFQSEQLDVAKAKVCCCLHFAKIQNETGVFLWRETGI